MQAPRQKSHADQNNWPNDQELVGVPHCNSVSIVPDSQPGEALLQCQPLHFPNAQSIVWYESVSTVRSPTTRSSAKTAQHRKADSVPTKARSVSSDLSIVDCIILFVSFDKEWKTCSWWWGCCIQHHFDLHTYKYQIKTLLHRGNALLLLMTCLVSWDTIAMAMDHLKKEMLPNPCIIHDQPCEMWSLQMSWERDLMICTVLYYFCVCVDWYPSWALMNCKCKTCNPNRWCLHAPKTNVHCTDHSALHRVKL